MLNQASNREPLNQAPSDLQQFAESENLFLATEGALHEKLDGFAKYASRQAIAKFLTKYELFKRILGVNGSIIEGGVLGGAGTLAWAKLSSILEPVNHTRKIFGFDTFSGFPYVSAEDVNHSDGSLVSSGSLRGCSFDEVQNAIRVYDLNRPLSHIPKVQLFKGDISQTAPVFVEENPHLVVSLLYLDVDLYEPTKVLLECFVPKMVKGSVIVFDELNAKMFPGETLAVDQVLGLRNLRVERFPFDSYVSFAVID